MATQYLSRSLLSKPSKTLNSIFSRSFSSVTTTTANSVVSRPSLSLLHRLRPLASLPSFSFSNSRPFATRTTNSSLNDPSPNWSNRPPKETILLDGCDFEHWLVVMEKPEGDPTRDEIIDSYIKTLAEIVGSEEEARMKIYSVSTRCYFAFGALVSEELSEKLKGLPKVRWVLPDSYLDVKNKDYGGEPFIDGKAVPYDPKYHEEWIRNNSRANERNRRNDRPRNFDRSRNFERRRENMQNRDFQHSGGAPTPNQGGMPNNPPMSNHGMQNPPPNIGGMPNNPPMPNQGMQYSPPNIGGMPNRGMPPSNNSMSGVPPPPPPPPNMNGMPQNNIGGMPQNNYGGGQPNMRGMPQNNYGVPPNTRGMPPNNNMGGMPPNNNMGAMPPNSNIGGMPPNNNMGGGMPPNNNMGGGMPPNAGWSGNVPGHAQNYQYGPNSGGMPYQGSAPNASYQNYTPNRD
ncbi:hypothetical protein HS088_TW21G00423 [Tripterygium wilfordii]|uniref:MORF/ORRM1/DAG-like MORF domain-containing protein n=1 Tax=Tripterygium wilfordii TaxID=458696 RepID=A0A7J7C2E1_TRIWF|nr:multiple organellar RNA editing factor 8, chloroplastic/mitochondrial-like [Tripterygium wilfordii]KAF5728278.1 hypothetical protein HS088_TW21G00423 [Tripterygium wilfordii]